MTTKEVQAWAKGLSCLEPVKIKVRKTLWLSHVVSTSFCLSHPTVAPQPPVVHGHGLQITCLSFRLDFIWRHRRFYQGKQVWESSLCLWLAWEQHHTIFSTSHDLITDFQSLNSYCLCRHFNHNLNFFKILFHVDHFLKVFIEFITLLLLLFYVLAFWSWGTRHLDLSFPGRVQTCTSCIVRWSLNHWGIRKVLKISLDKQKILWIFCPAFTSR